MTQLFSNYCETQRHSQSGHALNKFNFAQKMTNSTVQSEWGNSEPPFRKGSRRTLWRRLAEWKFAEDPVVGFNHLE
jgi:hypothetical protein